MGIDARMLIILPYIPTAAQIALWSWDIAAALSADKFMVPAITSAEAYDKEELTGKIWYQDGPSIQAKENEFFLSVNLWSRYYGVGYERGDLIGLISVAEWIERNIPDSTVFYGGDSSGVCAEPWNKEEREKLLSHFMGEHGRDYYSSFGTLDRSSYSPPGCANCVPERSQRRHGWGGEFAAYYCPGCGKSQETHDSGKTWEERKR